MKAAYRIAIGFTVFVLFGACASQEPAPEPAPELAEPEQPADDVATGPLDGPRVAAFETAAGARLEPLSIVTLPTGGPPEGRLLPTSTNPDATLYVTRDGSVPSAENNWGGPIDPANPRAISRPLEGTTSYRVVAELNGEYSEPFTVTIVWEHEESPDVSAPVFLLDGEEVRGSVEIPVSDGTDRSRRLEISCGYDAATLYLTRDGSTPTVDDYWETQTCAGTVIWAPEPTRSLYRVIAVWQGVSSPVASLDVRWVE